MDKKDLLDGICLGIAIAGVIVLFILISVFLDLGV